MQRLVVRVSLTHSEPLRCSYWNGWSYPLLTHVTRDGWYMGRGGVLILGSLMLWWQVAEQRVIAHPCYTEPLAPEASGGY